MLLVCQVAVPSISLFISMTFRYVVVVCMRFLLCLMCTGVTFLCGLMCVVVECSVLLLSGCGMLFKRVQWVYGML